MQRRATAFAHLPTEVVAAVFGHEERQWLPIVARVCQHWRNIALSLVHSRPALWHGAQFYLCISSKHIWRAAARGYTSLVLWLREDVGLPWDLKVANAAANNGHGKTLRAISLVVRPLDACPMNADTMRRALDCRVDLMLILSIWRALEPASAMPLALAVAAGDITLVQRLTRLRARVSVTTAVIALITRSRGIAKTLRLARNRPLMARAIAAIFEALDVNARVDLGAGADHTRAVMVMRVARLRSDLVFPGEALVRAVAVSSALNVQKLAMHSSKSVWPYIFLRRGIAWNKIVYRALEAKDTLRAYAFAFTKTHAPRGSILPVHPSVSSFGHDGPAPVLSVAHHFWPRSRTLYEHVWLDIPSGVGVYYISSNHVGLLLRMLHTPGGDGSERKDTTHDIPGHDNTAAQLAHCAALRCRAVDNAPALQRRRPRAVRREGYHRKR